MTKSRSKWGLALLLNKSIRRAINEELIVRLYHIDVGKAKILFNHRRGLQTFGDLRNDAFLDVNRPDVFSQNRQLRPK